MKIIYTAADGNTAVVTPAPQAHLARVMPEVADMTPQQYVEFIRDRDVPLGATNVSIVPATSIPTDRHFRNALKHDLTYDMPKCVEITQERLRREREPLLQAQDTEYMRALEEGKPTGPIVAEKNRLRDITKLPKPNMTTDELKALTAAK